MKILNKVCAILVSAVLLIGISGCGNQKVTNQKVGNEVSGSKKEVIATLFPQYDFIREIAKDNVNVTLLLPPGVESHSFEPTPQDIAKISKSDLFVYTGKYMEPWAQKIIDSLSGKKTQIVDTSKGIELMDETSHHEEHEEGNHENAEGDAFEWAGAFELKNGEMNLSFAKKEGKYADESMKIVFLETVEKGEKAIEALRKNALVLAKGKAEDKNPQDTASISSGKLYNLKFDNAKDVSMFKVKVEKDSTYVLFTQHMPSEFEGKEHFFKTVSGNDIEAVAMNPKEEHGHSHGGKDPHIWLDPIIAQKMVDNILEYLVKVDSSNEAFYRENANNYKSKLAELDRNFSGELKKVKSNKIIYGGHFAFGYFAKRYNLTHISPYEGFAPNAEPTPKKIADLIKNLKESGSTAIYYEENIEPKVARVISEQTGAKMLLLHGAHNVSKEEIAKGVTYIKIMQDNLANLKEGLGYGR
jgi:ABC-type Zn uptake system ZnuABC Zn-binding protein ZnuA